MAIQNLTCHCAAAPDGFIITDKQSFQGPAHTLEPNNRATEQLSANRAGLLLAACSQCTQTAQSLTLATFSGPSARAFQRESPRINTIFNNFGWARPKLVHGCGAQTPDGNHKEVATGWNRTHSTPEDE